MSTKKDQVTKGLLEIGSCWAGSFDRYICTNYNCCQPLDGDKRAYHIHPDSSYPHQSSIKRFENLDEIAEYIKARKSASKAAQDYSDQFDCPSPQECERINLEANSRAYAIMEEFWASH